MNFLQPVLAILFFIAPIILIVGLIKGLGKQSDFYEYILLSTGSVLISLFAYLLSYSWINGQSVFDALWDSFHQTFVNGVVNTNQLLAMYHQWGIFQNFSTADQLADYLISQMKIAVPAGILLFSMIYGTVLLLIIRLILKKTGQETPAVRPFEEWALPKRMAVGLVLLLFVAFLGRGLGIRNFDVVQFTIAVLISFLFTVIGLSVLWFFLKAGRVPCFLRWLLVILAYLMIGFILPLLGLFDQLFHLRWNYKNKFLFKNGR